MARLIVFLHVANLTLAALNHNVAAIFGWTAALLYSLREVSR